MNDFVMAALILVVLAAVGNFAGGDKVNLSCHGSKAGWISVCN